MRDNLSRLLFAIDIIFMKVRILPRNSETTCALKRVMSLIEHVCSRTKSHRFLENTLFALSGLLSHS